MNLFNMFNKKTPTEPESGNGEIAIRGRVPTLKLEKIRKYDASKDEWIDIEIKDGDN